MARYGNDFGRGDRWAAGYDRDFGGRDYGRDFTAGSGHYNRVHDDWHIDRGRGGFDRGGDWNGGGRAWRDEGSWSGPASFGTGWSGGDVHDRQYGFSGYAGRRHDLGGPGPGGGEYGYEGGDFGGGLGFRGGRSGYGYGGGGYGSRGRELDRWNRGGFRAARGGYGGDFPRRYDEDLGDRVREGWDHIRDRSREIFRR